MALRIVYPPVFHALFIMFKKNYNVINDIIIAMALRVWHPPVLHARAHHQQSCIKCL